MEHTNLPTSGTIDARRALVRLTDVNKHFGELHVLDNINLTVSQGEVVVVVVIGPSGSGKSTLCRAINRLETIDPGTIEVDGRVLPEEGRALAQLRADVGMVFQSFNLFAHKTVLQNVTRGQTLRIIQLPQVVQLMLPSLISQLVVLLKDSSLGFIVGYGELLSVMKNNYSFFGDSSRLPLFVAVVAIYLVVNLTLTRLAVFTERRLSSRIATPVDDLTVVR